MFITKGIIERHGMFGMLSSYGGNPEKQKMMLSALKKYLNACREKVFSNLPVQLLNELYDPDGKLKEIMGETVLRLLEWRNDVDREFSEKANSWKKYYDGFIRSRLPTALADYLEKSIIGCYHHITRVKFTGKSFELGFQYIWGRVNLILEGLPDAEKPFIPNCGALNNIEAEISANDRLRFLLLFANAEFAIETEKVDLTVEYCDYVSYIRLHGGDFKAVFQDIGSVLTEKEHLLGTDSLNPMEMALLAEYKELVPPDDKKQCNIVYYNFYTKAITATSGLPKADNYEGKWKWMSQSFFDTLGKAFEPFLGSQGFRGEFPNYFRIEKERVFYITFASGEGRLTLVTSYCRLNGSSERVCGVIPINEANVWDCRFMIPGLIETIKINGQKSSSVDMGNLDKLICDVLASLSGKKMSSVYKARRISLSYLVWVFLFSAVIIGAPAALIVEFLGWLFGGFESFFVFRRTMTLAIAVAVLFTVYFYRSEKKKLGEAGEKVET